MATTKGKERITFEGKDARKKWIEFVYHIKRNKTTVWDVLKAYLEDYINKTRKEKEWKEKNNY